LSPLQRKLLHEIGISPLRDEFFLTGGTALAALYLHHRYSVDLDLFTENPAAVAQVPPILQEIASRLGLEITFTRTLGTFLEAFATSPDGERVEFDFAQDSPYRLEPTRLDPDLDLGVDNPTDIACNSLSALFDRAEPKDFGRLFRRPGNSAFRPVGGARPSKARRHRRLLARNGSGPGRTVSSTVSHGETCVGG
jgi:hypothetical protein